MLTTKLKYRIMNREVHSSFNVMFPDGRTRSAVLLVSLSKIIGHWFPATKLENLGLIEGSDYFIAASPVKQDISVVPATMGQHEYQRVVLSLPAVVKLITREKTPLSNDLADWVGKKFIPKRFDGEFHSERHILRYFRKIVNMMTDDIRKEASSLNIVESRKFTFNILPQIVQGMAQHYILMGRLVRKQKLALKGSQK